MTLKTYSDGSEFTGKHLAVVAVAGTAIAVGLATAKFKYDDWRELRIVKREQKINQK